MIGNIRNINWFFTKTKTATQKGKRFKDKDRPTENTFKDLLASVVVKAERDHRAQTDTGVADPTKNGYVSMANDEQIKNYEPQKSDRTLAVAPSQLTEVTSGSEDIDVFKDDAEIKRNKFKIALSTAFKDWITSFKEDYDEFKNTVEDGLGGGIPEGGEAGQILSQDEEGNPLWITPEDKFIQSIEHQVTKSFDSDADIVVVIAGGNFSSYVTTITTQMQAWFSKFKTANPWYSGAIHFNTAPTTDEGEGYLKWPKTYGSDRGIKKAVFISFIDQANPRYHGLSVTGAISEVPSTDYKNDFDNFIQNYDNFDFFRNIIYAIPTTSSAGTACFHTHILKAVNNGTTSDYVESPVVLDNGFDFAFITSSNAYSTVLNPDSLSGNYSGLSLYGFSEIHDFATDAITTDLVGEAFDVKLYEYLFNSGSNRHSITLKASIDEETLYESTFNIDVPVYLLDWSEDESGTTIEVLPAIVNLTALSENDLTDNDRYLVEETASDFYYNAEAVEGDYAPDDQSGGTGFWIKIGGDSDITIGGNEGEILTSDGAGSTSTSSNLTFINQLLSLVGILGIKAKDATVHAPFYVQNSSSVDIFNFFNTGYFEIIESVQSLSATAGYNKIYSSSSDGHLKSLNSTLGSRDLDRDKLSNQKDAAFGVELKGGSPVFNGETLKYNLMLTAQDDRIPQKYQSEITADITEANNTFKLKDGYALTSVLAINTGTAAITDLIVTVNGVTVVDIGAASKTIPANNTSVPVWGCATEIDVTALNGNEYGFGVSLTGADWTNKNLSLIYNTKKIK